MKKIGFFNRLFGILKWKFGKYHYRIQLVSNNPKPENIQKGIVYVVGGKEYIKWAYIKCPDGCGDIIMLNLSRKNSAIWKVKQDKIGRVSIKPSIHKLDGCKSHFWIKKGNILWAS